MTVTTSLPAPVGARRVSDRSVVWSLTVRGFIRMTRRPSLIIPAIIMPVFFVVAFSGSFGGLVTQFPDLYRTSHMVNWMTPYAVLQGASFAGVGAAASTAADLELGFFDRLLLSPCRRTTLLVGPLAYAALRCLIPTVIVLIVAAFMGLEFNGGVLGVAMLVIAAMGTSLLFATFGLALVYKIRSMKALAIVQVLIFVVTFLSIGQTPLPLQTGWLAAVSRINPMTNILRMSRQGFLTPGDVTWAQTWPGLLAIFGSVAVGGLLAMRGLRRILP